MTYICDRFIFQYHAKRFFRCMSKIYGCQRQKQIRAAENYNAGKIPSKRRRVPYWIAINADTDESSATVSTSSDGDAECPYFDRCQKVTPHAAMHFADQVIMGGTHGFHNTAAPESSHPRCIAQAALRSRTYHDVNFSSQKMLDYLSDKDQKRQIIEFATLSSSQSSTERPILRVVHGGYPLEKMSLTMPIRVTGFLNGGGRGLTLQSRMIHHDTWNLILNEGVPVSLLELVQLTVDHLGLPVNMDNSRQLLTCDWQLGWRVLCTTSDGTKRRFRGGGVTPSTTSPYLSGDWLETNVTDSTVNGVTTSRLARMICGFKISGVKRIMGVDYPNQTWETDINKATDTLFFILVRYAAPHPNSQGRRGPKDRPLCPGVLRSTHCLWSWAKRSAGFRRGCFTPCHWERNKRFFGNDNDEQEKRKEGEKLAWYDLIQVHEISSHANVQLDPDRDLAFLQSVMWC